MMGSSLLLESGWCDREDHDQTGDDEAAGNERDQYDGASGCRELASDNVVLRLEVAMEAKQEDEDSCERSQRFIFG